MIAYVDASVLLRVALGQPNALPEWPQIEQGVSSALITTESLLTFGSSPTANTPHSRASRSKARNPACWKCSSGVRASVIRRACITTNETQSVSPHSLSRRSA
jgi:hypothetical protein